MIESLYSVIQPKELWVFFFFFHSEGITEIEILLFGKDT